MSSNIGITLTESISGQVEFVSGKVAGDFDVVLASDEVTTVPFAEFDEPADGNYNLGNFTPPSSTSAQGALVKVKVDNNVVDSFNKFRVYATGDEPYTKTKLETDFMSATGDTVSGVYTISGVVISLSSYIDQNSPAFINSAPTTTMNIWRGWADANYATISSLTSVSSQLSNFVTILTNQTIYGQKTFYLNPNEGFQMQMQSDPPNGGVIGWNSKPLASNKMLHDFKNSALTGTGNVLCSTASINTTSSIYISGNPKLNDLVWRKWVVDNFQSIAGGFQSKTVIVDSESAETEDLKLYPTINEAIDGIIESGQILASDNIWTIYIKQHSNSTGYAESIELPDYLNLIGEGVVRIQGQFTRPVTSEVLSSKIQNLHITSGIAQSHNLERLEIFDCIFTAGDSISLESSKLNNVEMYALSNITSNDNNKIKNCIGNKDISWQTNDIVLGYDFISGIAY